MNVKPYVRTQNIGDAELPYLEYEGDGPTIVFIHATGFQSWLWHPIAGEFAGKHRVIVPCFSAYRSADDHEGVFAWSLLARDLYTLCSELGIRKPVLVGHSMGGVIAALAVALNGLKADKMVIIEPIFLPELSYKTKTTVEQHPLAGRAVKRRNSWDNLDEAEKYFKSKILYQNWDREIFDLFLEHGLKENDDGFTLSCHPTTEAAQFMGGIDFDPWPVLGKVECPVLVVEGVNSENRVFIDYKKVAGNFPQGTFKQIEGAGHLVPMEQPGKMIRCIKEFLA